MNNRSFDTPEPFRLTRFIRSRRAQRGQTLVMTAMALPVLLGFAAMVIDVGDLWANKRLMQAAADAAAVAGADALYRASGTVTTDALNAASQNGFTAGASTKMSPNPTSVSVNNPPTSGPFKGNNRAVEVVVTQKQPTFFLPIIGMKTVNMTVSAVATAKSSDVCIYIMNKSVSGALTMSGSAELNSSCGVYVNSSSSSAIKLSGSASLSAPLIGVVGGVSSTGAASKPATTGIASFGDPLSYMTPPSVGSCTATDFKWSKGTTTISPGTYCGGIDVSSGSVTFSPGVYVIDGGGFSVSGSSTVSGSGVTFYFTDGYSSYKGVNFSGGSLENFSAPTSGPLEGMLFYQDPSIGGGASSSISGGSGTTFDGAMYFPTTDVTYSGKSSLDGYSIIVADTLTLTGSSDLGDNYITLADGDPIRGVALTF